MRRAKQNLHVIRVSIHPNNARLFMLERYLKRHSHLLNKMRRIFQQQVGGGETEQ
jgi:predicted protein tyrosine phosphatase